MISLDAKIASCPSRGGRRDLGLLFRLKKPPQFLVEE
jgi:hypothetical protein